MAARYVAIVDIQRYLNIGRESVLTKAKHLGITIDIIRRPGSGQAVRAVTEDDAARIIKSLCVVRAEFVSPAELMKEES